MSDQELIARGREFVRSTEHAGGKHLVSALCDALEASSTPEPQGEPSDAQVLAALNRFYVPDGIHAKEMSNPPWERPDGCFGHCDLEGWHAPCQSVMTTVDARAALGLPVGLVEKESQASDDK